MSVRGTSGRICVKPGGTAEVRLLSQHSVGTEVFLYGSDASEMNGRSNVMYIGISLQEEMQQYAGTKTIALPKEGGTENVA